MCCIVAFITGTYAAQSSECEHCTRAKTQCGRDVRTCSILSAILVFASCSKPTRFAEIRINGNPAANLPYLFVVPGAHEPETRDQRAYDSMHGLAELNWFVVFYPYCLATIAVSLWLVCFIASRRIVQQTNAARLSYQTIPLFFVCSLALAALASCIWLFCSMLPCKVWSVLRENLSHCVGCVQRALLSTNIARELYVIVRDSVCL